MTITNTPDPALIQQAALRARIAQEHGISREDAALFLTQTDEATLRVHAAALATRLSPQVITNLAPREGNTPERERPTGMQEFVRGVFGSTE